VDVCSKKVGSSQPVLHADNKEHAARCGEADDAEEAEERGAGHQRGSHARGRIDIGTQPQGLLFDGQFPVPNPQLQTPGMPAEASCRGAS